MSAQNAATTQFESQRRLHIYSPEQVLRVPAQATPARRAVHSLIQGREPQVVESVPGRNSHLQKERQNRPLLSTLPSRTTYDPSLSWQTDDTFSQKRLTERCVCRTVNAAGESTSLTARGAELIVDSCRKIRLLFSAFPIVVPSLSW
jgi:hypothetical protein